MLYFFRRGGASMSCETRLDPDGPGYQLVVIENHTSRIEHFTQLPQLLAREHELLMAWRAQGWRDVGQPTKSSVDSWTGPR